MRQFLIESSGLWRPSEKKHTTPYHSNRFTSSHSPAQLAWDTFWNLFFSKRKLDETGDMDLLFLALRTSIVVRFQQATAIHKGRCAERARGILPWTPSKRLRLPICQDINVWKSQFVSPVKRFQTLHSNTNEATFGNLALTTFCCENCKLMARQNTQRLRGCWVAKPPQMPPASPLTSRHHRGSRSHRHGHGGGHGHSDGHGFTSPGGRCCHRCSCSWCAVLLSTAAALQRQGGNEAEANGRERTDKLHDHKG